MRVIEEEPKSEEAYGDVEKGSGHEKDHSNDEGSFFCLGLCFWYLDHITIDTVGVNNDHEEVDKCHE